MAFAVLVTFCWRLSLVLLFLPFSALDKVVNFRAAVAQAGQAVAFPALAPALASALASALARGLICAGLFVEVFMSLGVLAGTADRLAAFVLAGYCAATALLWKPFWRQPDFRLQGPSRGREMFWDFLKNFAVAGGFLALALGPGADGVQTFLADPLSSTNPYAASPEGSR